VDRPEHECFVVEVMVGIWELDEVMVAIFEALGWGEVSISIPLAQIVLHFSR